MTWEDEAYNLARPVLTKLTMAGADSKKRHKLIKQYIRSLEEYEQVLLGEWITSYCSDNKVWYGFVWKLILDSLNEQYASRSPNSTTGTARGGIDFAKAKQEIKCENVALKNGVELKSIGNRMVAICPFHSDTQPSFYIYLDTNSFYCFGCQTGGDSITLLDLFNQLKKQGQDHERRKARLQ